MTSTKLTKQPEENPISIGSTLLVVYKKSTAIWNYSVVGTKVVGPELLNLIQAKEILGWTRITTPGANPKTMCQSGNFRGCHSTIFSYYIHIISVSVIELKEKSYFRAYSVQKWPIILS